MLRSQDVLLALRLSLVREGETPTFQDLSIELGISASQVHAAMKRAVCCRLVDSRRRANHSHLHEFVVHGLKYVFPPVFTSIGRGVPTGVAAAPLRHHFALGDEMLPVWPHPKGTLLGEGLQPLHSAVRTSL